MYSQASLALAVIFWLCNFDWKLHCVCIVLWKKGLIKKVQTVVEIMDILFECMFEMEMVLILLHGYNRKSEAVVKCFNSAGEIWLKCLREVKRRTSPPVKNLFQQEGLQRWCWQNKWSLMIVAIRVSSWRSHFDECVLMKNVLIQIRLIKLYLSFLCLY